MRLTRLSLSRYGHFEALELALDPAPGRINLLLAPNGAGKSVLRGAFGDLLFGIGLRSPMSFRFEPRLMQLEAEGLAADGRGFTLRRRKTRDQSLLDAAGQPLDPALEAQLLGKSDRALLEKLYALDTERLREGGRGLLASGGLLAEALLAASGGLRDAQGLRQELDRARDELAPTRKSANRPFYKGLEQWNASRAALRAALLRPQEWRAQEEALAALRQSRAAAAAALAESSARLRALERGRRLRPLLARRQAAADWLAAHTDAPLLAPDLRARLTEAQHRQRQAADSLAEAERQLAALAAPLAEASADDALLAQSDRIVALREAAPPAERAHRALPAARALLAGLRADLDERLRTLGRDLPPDQAARALPPPDLLAALRRLAGAHPPLAAAAEAAPLRLVEARAALDALQAERAALPDPGAPAALEALLAELSRAGDPVAQAAAAARAEAAAAAQLETVLARLPAGLRDLPVLLALSPPEPGRLEAADQRLQAARAEAQRAARAEAQAEAAWRDTNARRSALQGAGTLPDAASLAAARAHRDRGWALIWRRAFSAEGPDAVGEAGFAAGQPLPLAFAAALAEADHLADRRMAEADRLAQDQALEQQLAERAAALDAARAGTAEADTQLAAATQAWTLLAEPLALPGTASLAELQRVLLGRDQALAARQALAEAVAASAELAARQQAAAERLAAALALPPGPLQGLLDQAEARLRASRLRLAEAERLEERLAIARQALAGAEREAALAASRLAEWRAEWAAVQARLGQDAATHPADAEVPLRLLEELGPLTARAQAQAGRIAELEQEVAGFRGACQELCAALSPGLDAATDPFSAARLLDAEREAHAARATRRDLLQRQQQAASLTRDKARQALAAAESGWRAVLAEAGAEAAGPALTRIALAEARAAEAAQLRACDQALEEAEAGPPEALRAELEALPPGPLDAALEEAQASRAAAEQALEQAVIAQTRAEEAMARLEDAEAIGRAQAEQAAAAAGLGRTLEDALLMQLAGRMLDAALAQLQQGADDRLLRRIGAHFASLTGGAYAGVSAQEDDRGLLRLAALAADGAETLVEDLSEGTRDQLFLALRLVAIADQGGGLPFLGDDILQSFDDGRARNAFRLLLDFSAGRQVILLTHHKHLVEVARDCLPAGALHLQRFG